MHKKRLPNERRASVQQAPTMRARSELNIAEAEQQRALQQKVALSEGSNFLQHLGEYSGHC